MVNIYAYGVEECLVGKFHGTKAEAIDYIVSIFKKHGVDDSNINIGHTFVRTKYDNGVETFSQLNERMWKVMPELCRVGDVHGDPPHHYEVECPDEFEHGEYKIIGTYFD